MQKKRFLSIALALVIVLSLLAGCGCQHEWKDANCRAPKTCKLCNETEGKKTDDHKWEDATTEAPKTCTVCGKTEGEKINVDARFKTANCKEVFGTWHGRYEADAAQMGNLPGTLKVAMKLTISYSNDGKMTLASELEDKEAFLQEFFWLNPCCLIIGCCPAPSSVCCWAAALFCCPESGGDGAFWWVRLWHLRWAGTGSGADRQNSL